MSIDEAIVHAREVAEKQRKDNDNCEYKADIKTIVCLSDEIGKTVFLTRAEAEQKLKEMNTNNGITEQKEKSKEQLSF